MTKLSRSPWSSLSCTIWKRIHSENADPFELPEIVRKCVYEARDRLFSGLVQGKEVLELGCGYGYNAFLLSKRAKFVLGVDIDEAAITMARRRYEGVENLGFLLEDCFAFLDRTERTGRTYDAVFLFEFIEHVNGFEQGLLLSKIHSILRPDGKLVLSTPNGTFVPFYRRNPYHARELSPKDLLSLLVERGFEVEDLKGQIPLFLFFVPVPWALYEKIWIRLGVFEAIHRLNDTPENSRTIFLSAVKK